MIRHSWTQPPEIWAGPVGQWKQVTHNNPSITPPWGEIKSLHWSSDGMNIQGWLVYPKDYNPSRRYPMMVVAHGGPAGTVNTGWPENFFNTLELSAHGYFVLNPNPRGSFGQGEKFTEANIKDFGYGDFRDILAGVDEVVKTLPVDNDRIGITGWSYGGYIDHVGGHADESLSRRSFRRRPRRLAELLRPKRHRRMDDSLFWSVSV